MSKRVFLGSDNSPLRLVMVVIAFALLGYYIVKNEAYIMLIPAAMGGAVFVKYFATLRKKEVDETK
ncbi:hypothetical protein GC194_03050 [bacterium]|nr:hypothetical protein [bacterium]